MKRKEIQDILNNNEFSPREKELLQFVATMLYHVSAHHSRQCKEFVKLFNLFAKHEILSQLDLLIEQYSTKQSG